MSGTHKTVNRFETTLAGSIDDSVTSVELSSVTGLATDGGTVTIDWKNSDNEKTPSLLEEVSYTGISGTTLTGCTRGVSGTAQSHSAGAKVVQLWSSYFWNEHVDAFKAEHTVAGAHTVDVISEKTTNTGVTVDGLLIKDGSATFTDKAPSINVKALAYLTAAQTNLTDGTWTLVNIDTEVYDTGADFNTTSHLFTAPATGYYLVTGKVLYDNAVADKTYKCAIYVDGAAVQENWAHSARIDTIGVQTTAICAVTAGQTIGLYARVDTGANTVDLSSSATGTNLAIQLLSQ